MHGHDLDRAWLRRCPGIQRLGERPLPRRPAFGLVVQRQRVDEAMGVEPIGCVADRSRGRPAATSNAPRAATAAGRVPRRRSPVRAQRRAARRARHPRTRCRCPRAQCAEHVAHRAGCTNCSSCGQRQPAPGRSQQRQPARCDRLRAAARAPAPTRSRITGRSRSGSRSTPRSTIRRRATGPRSARRARALATSTAMLQWAGGRAPRARSPARAPPRRRVAPARRDADSRLQPQRAAAVTGAAERRIAHRRQPRIVFVWKQQREVRVDPVDQRCARAKIASQLQRLAS